MSVIIHHGDSRDVLATLAADSIAACVTDPPYGLAFMGKRWDRGDTCAFDPDFWRLVLRALKPGGHLLAFGGTRTFHRLVCAIEDAGFEVRDQLAWLYGSGFPKSHDVSKAMDKAAGAEREVVGREKNWGRTRLEDGKNGFGDYAGEIERTIPTTDAARQWAGWGTALKPALEPICLARKPLTGTVAANVAAHGTGALNIDGCRVGTEERVNPPAASKGNVRIFESAGRIDALPTAATGRWPANVIHDGSAEATAGFPDSRSAGQYPSASAVRKGVTDFSGMQGALYDDSGSASRYFYSAKADAGDRLGSKHPTVKPVDLIAYLCRLVTPPGGTVLDPFAGSGTTGMACLREGFDAVLIEREAEYVADIRRRIAHVSGQDAPLFAASPQPDTPPPEGTAHLRRVRGRKIGPVGLRR